ncbi:MAG: crossover junction endodeoxyribonuclease RuvC [Caldisericaceae bacterium]
MAHRDTPFSVIGIDPGIATTGFAILKKDKDNITVLKYGTIETTKGTHLGERLKIIYLSIKNILEEYPIDFVAIEKIFFNTNLKTVVSVSEARGIILLAAEEYGKKVYEYTPLEAKKNILGNGRATKQEIQISLKQILNLEKIPKPDDAADAIAIALCHIYSYNYLVEAEDD